MIPTHPGLRNFAICVGLLVGSVIAILNPVVIYLVLDASKTSLLYTAVFDVVLFAVAAVAVGYVRTSRARWFTTLIALLLGLLPIMAVAELGITWLRFARHHQQRIDSGSDPLMVPHEELGWRLPLNARLRHRVPGAFDVVYETDGDGRRFIAQTTSGGRTIHFFGDSILFGWGVNNDDTALQLLAERMPDGVKVINHAVIGYGLEQMLVLLREAQSLIAPGDTVVFAPASHDLKRNLIHKGSVCAARLSDGVQTFPRRVGDSIRTVRLADECSLVFDTLGLNSSLLLGTAYRAYRIAEVREELVRNANDLIADAEDTVQRLGADWVLMFISSPRNCQVGRYSFDLERITHPYLSLLSRCPDGEVELAALGFPNDYGHWTPAGNAWAAGAIRDLLVEQRVLGSTSPNKPPNAPAPGHQ